MVKFERWERLPNEIKLGYQHELSPCIIWNDSSIVFCAGPFVIHQHTSILLSFNRTSAFYTSNLLPNSHQYHKISINMSALKVVKTQFFCFDPTFANLIFCKCLQRARMSLKLKLLLCRICFHCKRKRSLIWFRLWRKVVCRNLTVSVFSTELFFFV